VPLEEELKFEHFNFERDLDTQLDHTRRRGGQYRMQRGLW
jgi:hypothetical protein